MWQFFLNFREGIADTTVTVGFTANTWEKFMNGVLEIDTVLQHVRQVAEGFHVPMDAVITQQILLLGDSFYGYRFTAADFTAIWSATDQTLKVFDPDGQILKVVPIKETTESISIETIQMPPLRRAA